MTKTYGQTGYTATMVEPSHDEQTWALMAYIGQFVMVGFAPAIVLLVKGRSRYIRRHAAQGLNLALSVLAVWLVGWLLSLAASWLLLVPVAYALLSVGFLIRAAMAANQADFYRIPTVFAWPLVK